jgi:CheY-like chemotaxis protein
VRQILANFVGNAVKFTQTGRIMISVGRAADEACPEAGGLLIAVRDTGVGMSEAAQGRLFQRFSQADSSTTRLYGGAGLGLSICKDLAELMGGAIGVESREGQGSTFWVRLPLAEAAPVEVEAAAIAGAPTVPAPATTGRALHVLAVDDHPINRKILSLFLEGAGARVSLAEGGEAAVTRAAGGGLDLVLLDIEMPEMDGLAAARAIRALGAPAGEVPIVALSAHAGEAAKAAALAAGMDDYLTKPIDLASLERVLEAAAGGRCAGSSELTPLRRTA